MHQFEIIPGHSIASQDLQRATMFRRRKSKHIGVCFVLISVVFIGYVVVFHRSLKFESASQIPKDAEIIQGMRFAGKVKPLKSPHFIGRQDQENEFPEAASGMQRKDESLVENDENVIKNDKGEFIGMKLFPHGLEAELHNAPVRRSKKILAQVLREHRAFIQKSAVDELVSQNENSVQDLLESDEKDQRAQPEDDNGKPEVSHFPFEDTSISTTARKSLGVRRTNRGFGQPHQQRFEKELPKPNHAVEEKDVLFTTEKKFVSQSSGKKENEIRLAGDIRFEGRDDIHKQMIESGTNLHQPQHGNDLVNAASGSNNRYDSYKVKKDEGMGNAVDEQLYLGQNKHIVPIPRKHPQRNDGLWQRRSIEQFPDAKSSHELDRDDIRLGMPEVRKVQKRLGHRANLFSNVDEQENEQNGLLLRRQNEDILRKAIKTHAGQDQKNPNKPYIEHSRQGANNNMVPKDGDGRLGPDFVMKKDGPILRGGNGLAVRPFGNNGQNPFLGQGFAAENSHIEKREFKDRPKLRNSRSVGTQRKEKQGIFQRGDLHDSRQAQPGNQHDNGREAAVAVGQYPNRRSLTSIDESFLNAESQQMWTGEEHPFSVNKRISLSEKDVRQSYLRLQNESKSHTGVFQGTVNVEHQVNIEKIFTKGGNGETTLLYPHTNYFRSKINSQTLKLSNSDEGLFNKSPKMLIGRSPKSTVLVEDISQPLDFRARCLQFSFPDGLGPLCIHRAGEDTDVSDVIAKSGNYKPELMDQILTILDRDPALGFVDIGAGIGVFSLSAALIGRKVVAVEPFFKNFRLLHKSALINHVADRITLVTNALGNNSYVGQLSYIRGKTGTNSIRIVPLKPGNHVASATTVKVTTLDNLRQVMPFWRAVLKLDIGNGAESDILENGQEFFRHVDVPFIITNWSAVMGKAERFRLMTTLSNLGYVPMRGLKGPEIEGDEIALPKKKGFLIWAKSGNSKRVV